MSQAEKTLSHFLLQHESEAGKVSLGKGERVNYGHEYVIRITKGTLDVYLVSLDGSETLVSTLKDGQITGICDVFAGQDVNNIIISRTQCELLLFPKEWMKKQLVADSELFTEYAKLMNEKLHFLTERIGQLSTVTATARLAECLVSMDEGNKLEKLKKSEIAKAARMSRSSFYRSLSALEAEGLISLEGDGIKILDREGLSNYC